MAMQLLKRVTAMTQLKIKDNTPISKENFNEVSNVAEKIADKTLEQLEKEGVFVFPELIKDADDITKEQVILQSVNDCFRSSNVMGFLGCGEERLVIESRFSTGEHDYFFQYLLERLLELPNIMDLMTDANQDRSMFNLLPFLFPYYLNKAMRKGIYKTYIRDQYNDGNVKGTIDIARHIRKNSPFIGNIAYNQREFSYDNYLMELVRHTIEFIKKKRYGYMLLRKVKDEVTSVIEATTGYEYFDRRKIITENMENPIRHAYYHEYRELQRLCIRILRYEKIRIGSSERPIHGILFDGAWLWEEYVNLLIKDGFNHPRNKGRTGGAQQLFAGDTRETGLIYPDFISRETDNRIIADAKYKPVNNIKSSDYQQLLAYMFRFDAKTGFYLYPQSQEGDNIVLRLNCGSTYENNVVPRDDTKIIKCGLKIPNPEGVIDYKDFVVKIKESEEQFKNCILIDNML